LAEQPKLGAQFDAWVREGAKDLHNRIVPSQGMQGPGVDEQGTPLNPTPQIVTEEMQGYDAEVAAAAARGRPEEERGLER